MTKIKINKDEGEGDPNPEISYHRQILWNDLGSSQWLRRERQKNPTEINIKWISYWIPTNILSIERLSSFELVASSVNGIWWPNYPSRNTLAFKYGQKFFGTNFIKLSNPLENRFVFRFRDGSLAHSPYQDSANSKWVVLQNKKIPQPIIIL